MSLGAAATIRPEALISILALVVVLTTDKSAWSSLGWLAIGLGAAGIAAWGYQVTVLGKPAADHITANLNPVRFDLWSLQRLFDTSQMVVESRHLGVLVLLGAAAAAFGLSWIYRALLSGSILWFGGATACSGLVIFAIGAGLLLFRGRVPVDLLTSVPVVFSMAMHAGMCGKAIPPPCWRRPLMVWCALVVALSVVLASNSGGPYGPRYLTAVIAPLVVLSVEARDRLERGTASGLARGPVNAAFVALILVGMVTQGAGLVKLWQLRAGNHALSRAVLRPPQPVAVTDIWFVPQIAPEVYGKIPIFLVRTADEWVDLEDRLASQGVKRVRVVHLADRETPLRTCIPIRWRAPRDTLVRVRSVPPLHVIDYVSTGTE